jgi:L-aminopeptidase/D-esterase-like protein
VQTTNKSCCLIGLAVLFLSASITGAQEAPRRARDLGVPFDGKPGPLNAVTDVAGVEVGHVTIIEGEGALEVGVGPIRTGVTAIHPRGKDSTDPVFAGWFTLNASGEMTGTTWLEERGLLDGPILITNTHSVGVARDAAVAWMVDKGWKAVWHAPVAAETYDGALNDINGFHVTKEHALEALSTASGGVVAEGVVGGGTGMICNGFKGGIGTASRIILREDQTYTVGVLVQCNYQWERRTLRIAGVPVGQKIDAPPNCFTDPSIERHVPWFPYCEGDAPGEGPASPDQDGSIIIVVATDAPLLPHQIKRLAKRPSLALGRLGTWSNDGSGDIFIAFSTAGAGRINEDSESEVTMFPNNQLSVLFEAVVQATEEAIVNAMVAAETTVGVAGLRVEELPEDQLEALMAGRRDSPSAVDTR